MTTPSSIAEVETLMLAGRGPEAYARALALLTVDTGANGVKGADVAATLLRAAVVTERHREAAAALRDHRARIDAVAYARVQASLALLSGDVAEARAQAEALAGTPDAAVARLEILITVAERVGAPDVALELMRERERVTPRYPLAWVIARWGTQRLLGMNETVVAESSELEGRIPATHPAERRVVRLNRTAALLAMARFDDAVTVALETVGEMLDMGAWPAPRAATVRMGTRARQHRVLADIEWLVITRNLPVALVAGSLLWLTRDGDFNGHDTDMDLAVIPPTTSAEVFDTLIATGLFRPQPREIDFGSFRALTHVETGLAVDVVEYRLEDGRFVSTWRHPSGTILRRSAVPPFTIRPTFHEGVRRLVPLPDDPDALLTATYGNWRTPAPDFDSVVSSPAILEFTGFLAGIAALRLLEAMMEGATDKAAHLARRLRDHDVAPELMDRVIAAAAGRD